MVEAVVYKNRITHIVAEMDIGYGSVYSIIHDHLKFF
jgi:hypothetical protein